MEIQVSSTLQLLSNFSGNMSAWTAVDHSVKFFTARTILQSGWAWYAYTSWLRNVNRASPMVRLELPELASEIHARSII